MSETDEDHAQQVSKVKCFLAGAQHVLLLLLQERGDRRRKQTQNKETNVMFVVKDFPQGHSTQLFLFFLTVEWHIIPLTEVICIHEVYNIPKSAILP